MDAHNFPLAISFSHHFRRKVVARSVVLMGGAMAYFAWGEPFDSMHQKMLFVLHHENVSAWLALSRAESSSLSFLVSCKHMNKSCIWFLQIVHLAWRTSLRISRTCLEWRMSIVLLSLWTIITLISLYPFSAVRFFFPLWHLVELVSAR